MPRWAPPARCDLKAALDRGFDTTRDFLWRWQYGSPTIPRTGTLTWWSCAAGWPSRHHERLSRVDGHDRGTCFRTKTFSNSLPSIKRARIRVCWQTTLVSAGHASPIFCANTMVRFGINRSPWREAPPRSLYDSGHIRIERFAIASSTRMERKVLFPERQLFGVRDSHHLRFLLTLIMPAANLCELTIPCRSNASIRGSTRLCVWNLGHIMTDRGQLGVIVAERIKDTE